MAQQLREHIACIDDPGSVPSTYMVVHNHL